MKKRMIDDESYDPVIFIYKLIKEHKRISFNLCYEEFLKEIHRDDDVSWRQRFLFHVNELIGCGLVGYYNESKSSKDVLEIRCETWSYI